MAFSPLPSGTRPAASLLLAACAALGHAGSAVAGPFSGPTDTSGFADAGVPSGDSRFVEWADAIDASRTAFAPRGSSSNSDTGFNSLGDLTTEEIAAGAEPGRLTVTFPTGIRDGTGADFAVFENGFVFPSAPFLFAEYAYVEASTNGTDFARFASVSTNTTFAGGFGPGFAGYDSTNVFNLAGKHASGIGTPFDLAGLAGDPLVPAGLLDLDDIRYVRLVDIPGDGSFLDSLGNPILDNHLTSGNGGFDFRLPVGRGVGVIHAVPEPTGLAAVAAGGALLLRRRRRGPTVRAGRTARDAGTSTTFAALSLRDGDAYAKPFGGANGTDCDRVGATFTGFQRPGGNGARTGSVKVVLAEHTPAYVALDELASEAVPEFAGGSLAAAGPVVLSRRRGAGW